MSDDLNDLSWPAQIARIRAEYTDRIEALEREAILNAKLLADTQALLDTAVEFIQEVRRNGDTRLASMAIAVLAEIEKGKTNG